MVGVVDTSFLLQTTDGICLGISMPIHSHEQGNWKRRGSVVECLTQDQGVAGSCLTGGTALCSWARHFNPCLVLVQPRKTHLHRTELGDLKVLRRSPDLLNNVKICQGQLQLIMEQLLFYHIWGLQTFWSSDLNNLMNNPSNSQVISEKQMFR